MRNSIVLFLIILFTFITDVYADQIILSDGHIINGRILRISEKHIEYDPVGEKPFNMVPKKLVKKIIFGDEAKINQRDDGFKMDEADEIWSRSSACVSSCFLPFWSGSLNYGYDNWGLFFSLSKLSAMTLFFVGIERTSYYWDKSGNKKTAWGLVSIVSFYSYIILTIADIDYSTRVDNKNRKRCRVGFLKPKQRSALYFSLSPRYPSRMGSYKFERDNQGLDLSLGYRF